MSKGFFDVSKILTEITFKDLASARVFQPTNGLFLNLTHTFTRQVEFLADLLEGHRVAAVESEIESDHIGLTRCQRGDGSVNFFA